VLIPETDLTWGKVEVSEGEYDFSFVDDYLHFCEMYNIEPIGVFRTVSERVFRNWLRLPRASFVARLLVNRGWCEQVSMIRRACTTGHCMVWKGIGWMSEVPENTTDSQRTEIYLNRIENYIKTMMGRYKGIDARNAVHLATAEAGFSLVFLCAFAREPTTEVSNADRIKRWVVVNEFFNNTGQIRDDFIFIKTLGKIGIEKVCTVSHHLLPLYNP
jgi:GH35 family endo-1,4-beta-xylanase